MGLFDLPSPVFSAIDGWLAHFLPASVLVTVWAALAASLCMELYRVFSPQARIANVMRTFEGTRRRVIEFEGEFTEILPDIRAMLSLALRRVALVFPATIVSALPLLFVIVWIDGRYGDAYPPANEAVSVSVPGDFEARWVAGDDGAPHAEVTDLAGSPVADIAVAQPISVIHKRVWWNALFGNPAGYLDDSLPFDRIDIALPRREVVPFGPNWLRGWEGVFFAAMILFALTLKNVRGIA